MNLIERAKELVTRTGDRATANRVRTLSVLLAAKRALTHREIADAIAAHDAVRAHDAMYLHLIYNRKHIKSIN